jgi:hypothetical protein
MSIFVEALLVWFVVLALLIGFVAGADTRSLNILDEDE